MPGTPSIGSMLDLVRNRVVHAARSLLRSRAHVPHPCRSTREDLPWSKLAGSAPCYSNPSKRNLAASSDLLDKMLLTDFCNRLTTRAPALCSASGCRAFASTNPLRASLRLVCLSNSREGGTGLPCGKPAPNGYAIDAAHRASTSTSHSPLPFLGKCRAPLRAMLPLPGVIGPGQGWRRASLTPSVAPHHRPETRTPARSQNRLLPSVRQHGRLSRLRASSIDRCSRAPLSRSDFLETRHRSRGFATYGSASDIFSLP